MALGFIASFDTDIPLNQIFDTVTDSQTVAGAGRFGTAAMTESTAAYTTVRCVKYITFSSPSEVIMGFWLDLSAYTLSAVANVYASFHYAGTPSFSTSTKQITLRGSDTGVLKVMRGNWNGTQIGSDSAADILIPANGPVYVEMRCLIHSSAGEVEVRVDDIAVLEISGVNTDNKSSGAIDGVEYIGWTVDDAYALDLSGSRNNDFLGRRFHVIANDMDTASSTAWTAGGASNLASIAAADGTYNTAGSAGLVDLYNPVDLDASVGEILAVQAAMQGLYDSAGPTIADAADIGGGANFGTTQSLTGSSKAYLQMRESQPGGSTQWTRAVYNASTFGYKRIA